MLGLFPAYQENNMHETRETDRHTETDTEGEKEIETENENEIGRARGLIHIIF